MWIMTEQGFVSAVRKPGMEDLTVRSRDRRSLVGLAELAGVSITHTRSGDYPYRIVIGKDVMSQWLTGLVATLDYSNFKSHVHGVLGHEWAHTLSSVWSTMHDVEDGEARK